MATTIPYSDKTGDYTLLSSDQLVNFKGGSPATFTAPPTSGPPSPPNGWAFRIVNRGSADLTFAVRAGQTGGIVLAPGERAELHLQGADYVRL